MNLPGRRRFGQEEEHVEKETDRRDLIPKARLNSAGMYVYVCICIYAYVYTYVYVYGYRYAYTYV